MIGRTKLLNIGLAFIFALPIITLNSEYPINIECDFDFCSTSTIQSEKKLLNNEYLVIDDQRGKLEIFDGTTYQFVKEISYICTYAISDNSKYIAIADYDNNNNRFATISTFPDKKKIMEIPFFQDLSLGFFCSQQIAISSNGKFVAMAAPTGDIEVANIKNKNIINRFSMGDSGITDIEFSPDETYIAVVSVDADLTVWNIKTNSLVFTYSDPAKNLLSVGFSPDSRELVIIDNQWTSNIIFFSVENGKKTGEYTLNGGPGYIQVTKNNTVIVNDGYNVREISWLTKTDTGRYAKCTKSPDHENFVETGVNDSSLSSDGRRVAISCSYLNTDQMQVIVRDFDTGEIDYEFEYSPSVGSGAIPLVTFVK